MNADLARLIELQQIELDADEARRRIADAPRQAEALDARLSAAQQAVAHARERLTDSQTDRRTIEKDLAVIQGRLSKYKDQLMEVKTNREYQAMQKEIETAQVEVRTLEDRVLERMLEGDELIGAVKAAEAGLKDEEKAIASEREALSRQADALHHQLEQVSAARTAVVSAIDPQALAVYERVARGRKGVGVAQARDGICSVCHVRLRPQIYNEVRRNDAIIQCDSCQRILYFAAPQPAQPTA